MKELLEQIKFDGNGLVPVITQDYKTNEVLMMAYMNEEAFIKSMETGKVHYFSRSRNKLWLKGETSGHFQIIKSVNLDCDGDTILIKVEQIEAACHTGHYSCFYRELNKDGIKETSDKVFDEKSVYGDKSKILKEVYNVVVDRKINPKEGSYTNYLFEKGIDKMLKKVGEEAAEVIIASKNTDNGEVIYEISDLIYHLTVLMVERGITFDDIFDELGKRR
jgi:phosphoribosyl-ATP pyrophosphohydrolase/phosphoribosyl-AMP cyclohydrolase